MALAGIERSSLRDEIIVYDDLWSIYVTNGLGGNTRKLLSRKRRFSWQSFFKPGYTSYSHPSISPDGTRVACVRIITGYHFEGEIEYSSVLKYEGVLYSIKKKQEFTFFRSPGGNFKRVGNNAVEDNILSPIWSADGNKIYFLVSNRLLSYDLNLRKIQQVSELAPGHGGIVQLDMEYIRLSKDGAKIFAVVNGPENIGETCIWEVDLKDNSASELWRGESNVLWNRMYPSAYPSITDQLQDNDAVESLFGSRHSPVYYPHFSKHRRFYYYHMKREGFLSKWWIAGYDTAEKHEFTIKILQRAIYFE